VALTGGAGDERRAGGRATSPSADHQDIAELIVAPGSPRAFSTEITSSLWRLEYCFRRCGLLH